MSYKYEITEDQIAEALESVGPATTAFTVREVLEKLFPNYFKLDDPFCQVGDILQRKEYPGHRYVVVNISKAKIHPKDPTRYGYKLFCITTSQFWEPSIGESTRYKNAITYREFKQLVGTQNADNFSIAKI